MKPIYKGLFLTIFAILISGCSLFGGDDEEAYYISEPELYDKGIEAVQKGRYEDAVSNFEKLETHYPFGRYSEQAQLELIYSYYRRGDSALGLSAADRFLRLYPSHENIDYVYYIRGLINFEADKGIFDRFAPTDSSKRDPGAARDSFSDFSTLLNQFPNSEYSPDARKRMLYLKNQLAQYEIHVASYYIKRGAWIAAANRGRYIVENYQQTPAVPYGLSIMAHAYKELGLNDAANNAQEVLNTNFPTFNLNEEDKNSRSWLSILSLGWISDDEVPSAPSND